jgi:hydroxymethylglutaryl-CoA synthase
MEMNNQPNYQGKNVGILAMEVYTPSTFVSQEKLESYYGVDAGKYTLGLGQDGLAVCGDCEDVNSLALTVVQTLLEKYGLSPSEIGRLEVGTETLVDKSKSTKTVLMDLFGDNTDIEGATVINACYGGTAALFNAFNWVESDGWDGRFAIVVAADIAVYASGNARPTSGAGAVACLVGRDAPLAFSDPRLKATHASNVWDFFKPDHNVEYPTVNGALSQLCYYRALEDCYSRFADKMDKLYLNIPNGSDPDVSEKNIPASKFTTETVDFFAFHAPYNKLVQKSFARLFLLDAKRRLGDKLVNDGSLHDPLDKWVSLPLDQTYSDRDLENALKTVSSSSYKKRLTDANYASKKIGNTYTASVFMGLASLIDRAGSRGDLVAGKTVCVFSYGSGALASMYLLQV